MKRRTALTAAVALIGAATATWYATASAEPCEVDVTVTEMSPSIGFASGGTQVTILGENIDACGIGRVSFGGADGMDLTVVGADELTVTTPPGVGVVIPRLHYGDDQFADAPAFTYVPMPAVDRMLPPRGPSSGGTEVAIWGTHLVQDDTTTEVRFGDEPGALTVTQAGYLEAVAPAADPGTVDVSVVLTLSTGEQASTDPFPFDYEPPPTITAVAAADPVEGGDVIEIEGTDFTRGARVYVGRADGSDPPDDQTPLFEGSSTSPVVERVDDTLLRLILPDGRAGAANIIVANADGQFDVALGALTYDGDAPSITGVSPSSGPSLGGTPVTITGTGFATGATVQFGEGDTSRIASSVDVVSPTEIVVTSPAHPPANDVAVTVVNPDGSAATTLAAFDYTPSPAPTATSVSPATSPSLGGTQLTILGTGFANGAIVRFSTAVPVEQAAGVASSGRITLTTPPIPAGTVDVRIVNPDGQTSAPLSFTVTASPPPAIGTITPATGPTAGGTLVTITGSGFSQDATVAIGGVPLVAETDPTLGVREIVRDPATIIGVTPPGAVGNAEISVVNADGSSATVADGYSYAGPPPATLASIDPSVGTTLGGQSVVLTGANFAVGSAVTFGNGACTGCNVAATNVVVTSTSITAVTPAGLYGFQNVSVTSPSGTTTLLRYGFDFGDGADAPSIDRVDPATGATGSTITLAGSGFGASASAYIGDDRIEGTREQDVQGAPLVRPTVRDAGTIVGVVPRRTGGSFAVGVSNPDGQGVVAIDAFSYPIDDTAPVTAASATTGVPPSAYTFGATNWARRAVTLVLDATDGPTGSGVDSITYSASGAQTVIETTVSGDNTSIVVSAQGVTTVRFGATDIAGVTETPQERIVAIDGVGPSITPVTSFVPGTQVNQDVDVEFTCTDSTPGSGLAASPMAATSSNTISTSGTNPLTVTFTEQGIAQSVSVTCSDRAGNTTVTTFRGVNISQDGPTLVAVATTADGKPYVPGTWTNLDVVVTFVCRAPASVGPVRSPQVASVTPAQIISRSVTDLTVDGECRDSSGNVVTASFSGIRVDKQPPVVTATAASAGLPYSAGTWTNAPVIVTFTCVDDGPDQSTVASVSAPATISREGTTAGVTGECVDVAGNRADPAVFLGPVLIDTQAPICAVVMMPNPLTPPNGRPIQVAASITSTDVGSGVASVLLIEVATNAPRTAGSDISGFAIGTDDRTGSLVAARGRVYTVTYVVVDQAGNTSDPCSATVTVG